MLFCFTYFWFVWWACVVSQLKQLQVLVENKNGCYIYCNRNTEKGHIVVVFVCFITYLLLFFYAFCSNPSEVKHSRHKETIINLSGFWSYQTILE